MPSVYLIVLKNILNCRRKDGRVWPSDICQLVSKLGVGAQLYFPTILPNVKRTRNFFWIGTFTTESKPARIYPILSSTNAVVRSCGSILFSTDTKNKYLWNICLTPPSHILHQVSDGLIMDRAVQYCCQNCRLWSKDLWQFCQEYHWLPIVSFQKVCSANTCGIYLVLQLFPPPAAADLMWK